jgi:hypothetical protein
MKYVKQGREYSKNILNYLKKRKKKSLKRTENILTEDGLKNLIEKAITENFAFVIWQVTKVIDNVL